MNLEVANTILEQLGGARFVVMTGAKHLAGGETFLQMRVGSNARKVTNVRVELTPADTYTVTFYNIRGVNVRTLSQVCDVYAEQLQETFTEHTGLYTRF